LLDNSLENERRQLQVRERPPMFNLNELTKGKVSEKRWTANLQTYKPARKTEYSRTAAKSVRVSKGCGKWKSLRGGRKLKGEEARRTTPETEE